LSTPLWGEIIRICGRRVNGSDDDFCRDEFAVKLLREY